jgi:hypothetical protein
MKAHVISAGVVVNTIEVESLDFMPNLVDGENGGGIGDTYQNGQFIKPASPPKTPEHAQAEVRSERNRLLSESDWTQGKDIPDATSTAWAPYRQQLRDLTTQPGFPHVVVWPNTP